MAPREVGTRTYNELDLLSLVCEASSHELVHFPDLICSREFALELGLVRELDTYSGLG